MFKKYAFTLVELIVVITILAILGTIAFISLQGYSMEARDSKRLSDVNNTFKKITLERVKGVYPSNIMKDGVDTSTGLLVGGLAPTDAKQGNVDYKEIEEDGNNFKDPRGNEYVFSYGVGGSGIGAYKFVQLATVNEKRNEAVVVGDYYKVQTIDSESIVFSDPTNLNSPKVVNKQGVLPYDLTVTSTSTITNYSCALQPNYTNAVFVVGVPTIVDEPWQNTNNINACYYECTGGYSGVDCTTLPTCDSNYTYNIGTNSCEANDYTVIFDGNGGIGHTPTSLTVTYNTELGTLPIIPTRSGYTFTGWFTATSGGTQITTSTLVTGDVTYYAQRSVNSYTATFNGNGGSGHTPTSKSVTYNTAVGTLPSNPTRSGYTFTGWFTLASGGTQITTSTLVTGDVTYYAQWNVSVPDFQYCTTNVLSIIWTGGGKVWVTGYGGFTMSGFCVDACIYENPFTTSFYNFFPSNLRSVVTYTQWTNWWYGIGLSPSNYNCE